MTPIVDRVAGMIATGFKLIVASNPNVSVDKLRERIKDCVTFKYPQKRITLKYTIQIGDVLRPTTITPVTIAGVPIVLSPSQRYVVYSLSSPSSQYDLMERATSSDPHKQVKALILRYINVEDELDLTKIETVISCNSQYPLMPLLEHCELVGNVIDKLV